MSRVHLGIAVAIALTGSACGGRKQHLTESYARSYDEAFTAQRGRAPGPVATAVTGLDSQEAAIISEAYRAGLFPKDVKPKEEPILYVAPPTRDRPQTLAPSVPPLSREK